MVTLLLSVSLGSEAHALQGVVEQTIFIPDAIYDYHSTEIRLQADTFDAKPTNKVEWGGYPSFECWAKSLSSADAQKNANAEAEVVVLEHPVFGNYSNNTGMRSTRTLGETMDVDTVKVRFIPHDNPYGQVKVELIQKTYVTVKIKFARDDADNQTKYFNFRVANTLIDGSIQETSFQWSASTATSSTSGVGVEFSVNGEVQGTASWTETIEQGVDGFEHLVSSRVSSASRERTFTATGPGDVPPAAWEVAIDAGFNWDVNTVDNNSFSLWKDGSKLQGWATYNSVIGFGRITVLKNTDQSTTNCPKEYHPGTDIGNPEVANDRIVQSIVTYSLAP